MAKDKEELERLRRQLEDVTAERDRLRAENSRLRPEFGSPQKSHPADRSNLVSVASNHLGLHHPLYRRYLTKCGIMLPLTLSYINISFRIVCHKSQDGYAQVTEPLNTHCCYLPNVRGWG